MDAPLPLLLLLLATAAVRLTDATWCICKPDAGQAAVQKALDYACGAGADCGPIQQNGACFQPNTVLAHCSYAVNSYFQRKGQVQGSCDFAGSATVSTADPSSGTCTYPSTASAPGTPTGVTPVPGAPIGGATNPPPFTPTLNPPPTTNPGLTPTPPTNPGFTPGVGGGGAFTPGTTTGGGVLGGGVGLGPSGVSTDGTGGAAVLPRAAAASAAGLLSLAVLSFLVQ